MASGTSVTHNMFKNRFKRPKENKFKWYLILVISIVFIVLAVTVIALTVYLTKENDDTGKNDAQINLKETTMIPVKITQPDVPPTTRVVQTSTPEVTTVEQTSKTVATPKVVTFAPLTTTTSTTTRQTVPTTLPTSESTVISTRVQTTSIQTTNYIASSSGSTATNNELSTKATTAVPSSLPTTSSTAQNQSSVSKSSSTVQSTFSTQTQTKTSLQNAPSSSTTISTTSSTTIQKASSSPTTKITTSGALTTSIPSSLPTTQNPSSVQKASSTVQSTSSAQTQTKTSLQTAPQSSTTSFTTSSTTNQKSSSSPTTKTTTSGAPTTDASNTFPSIKLSGDYISSSSPFLLTCEVYNVSGWIDLQIYRNYGNNQSGLVAQMTAGEIVPTVIVIDDSLEFSAIHLSDAVTMVLMSKTFTCNHAGSYSCTVSSASLTLTDTKEIKVTDDPPEILLPSGIIEDRTMSIQCIVEFKGTSGDIKWTFSPPGLSNDFYDLNITPETKKSTTSCTSKLTSMLTFIPGMYDHGSNFRCEVVDVQGYNGTTVLQTTVPFFVIPNAICLNKVYTIQNHPYRQCGKIVYCSDVGPIVYDITCPKPGYCYDAVTTQCVPEANLTV